MFKAIVVDDEELSVRRLKRLLLESGEVDSCHTFLNPAEAYDFAKANPIDVAFLDISMPDMSGMTLSRQLLELDDSIQVVFATGFENYAVEAFEVNALDYLLKPVSAERLQQTIGKIRRQNVRKTASAPVIEVQLFNGLQLFNRSPEQESIKLRSPKTEELFVYLVCKGPVSRDQIIDALWNGLDPNKATKNLNTNIYYIRKALGDYNLGHVLLTGKTEIRLDANYMHCDLYEFERLLRMVRIDPERNTDLLRQAEVLYTGELLKGKTYDWISEDSRRLERLYTELLETAAKKCLQRGERREALHYYSELVKRDSLRDDIHVEIIRLYLELGRMHEAMLQYRQLEEILLQELGTAPDPQMRETLFGKDTKP